MGVDLGNHSGDGTPTLSEDVGDRVARRDSRPNAMTSQEIANYREWKRSQSAPASAPPPAPPQSVTAQLTAKHWTGIATALVGVLGVAGAGGYTGVSTMTAAEVSARDEAHRKVVSEELEKVVQTMTARADKDRDDAETKFKEVRDDIKGMKRDLHTIDKNLAVLAERGK